MIIIMMVTTGVRRRRRSGSKKREWVNGRGNHEDGEDDDVRCS